MLKKLTFLIILTIGLIVGLLGCTIKQFDKWSGLKADREKYVKIQMNSTKAIVQKWTEEDRKYDKEHNIKHRVDRWNIPLTFGMTTTKVYEKWGTATKDGESFSASGHFLVWKYGESWGRFGTYFPADTYLYFLDNKLIEIIKTR